MKLFEPLDINGMVIPNRIMVPAMVTHLCDDGGTVNDEVIERYAAYAEGGTGLIVVEAMAIHHNKSGALLRASEDKFIPGLRRLTQRVHEVSDSKIVPQIIHFMKVARTGWRQTVDTLTVEEIDVIVDQFGAAAARVQEAGFEESNFTRPTRTPCHPSSPAPIRARTATAATRWKADCG